MLLTLDALTLLIAQVRAGSLPLRASPVASMAKLGAANAPASASAASGARLRFCDIGANLLDPVFRGEYRGRTVHPADLHEVLARAAEVGVERCLVTAGSAEEAWAAIKLVRELRPTSPVALYSTVGVHPTRSLNFLPEGARSELEVLMAGVSAAEEAASAQGAPAMAVKEMENAAMALAAAQERLLATAEVASAAEAHVAELRRAVADGTSDGTVVAIGECGLDYARLFFSPAAVQRLAFDLQLRMAADLQLPLFLHSRDASDDMEAACRAHPSALGAGAVIHSFDGDADTLASLLNLGMEIGINGCSLRTPEGLSLAAKVPLDRLHLETDAPWCGIKRTHAGAEHVRPSAWEEVKKEKWEEGCRVKDRNEPAQIEQVLQVLAAARGGGEEEEAAVAAAALANSIRLFRLPCP
jgi:TatD DNase family protein